MYFFHRNWKEDHLGIFGFYMRYAWLSCMCILSEIIMLRCACANEAWGTVNRPGLSVVCLCASVCHCLSSLFPLRRANAEAFKCLYRYRVILARFIFKQNSESRFSLWVWRDLLTLTPELREIQSQEKTKLSTADCFSTRQSRLCHGPAGSNTSVKTKTRLSKASCHLPVRRSVAAIEGVAA